MTTKRSSAVKPDDLTPREGKVLRYYASKLKGGEKQTATDSCIVKTPWSDLPHNHMQAVQTCAKLKAKGLLVAGQTKGWVTATAAGVRLIAKANELGMWQVPPSPKKTNNARYL